MTASTRTSRLPRSRRRQAAVIAVAAGIALVALGCSSSKKTDTSTDASTTTTVSAYGEAPDSTASTAAPSGTAVAVATTSLGSVVVDSKGLTLYFYKNDTGSTSTCTGACATAWPPAAATGTPKAGDGVTAPLTTTTRPDGAAQLVLGGHPLYRFSGDAAPGDVNGQDVGDVWYAAGPDGQPVG